MIRRQRQINITVTAHESIDFNNDACDCDAVATGITSIAQNELHNFKLAALALHVDRTRNEDVPVSSPLNSRSPGYLALVVIPVIFYKWKSAA